MGDNRNFSIDSRYFGFIDKKDIMGKVLAYWETESNKFRKERFWKFISFPESK